MSDKVEISGTVKVEDQASPTIRRIQQNIMKIGDSARKMGASFSRLANMGAFGGLTKNIRGATSALGGLAKGVMGLGSKLAGLVGIAGFGGLAYEMQNYVNSTDELAKASQRIGITVEQLQQFRHAATLSGVSVETLDASMMNLNRRLGEAAAKGGKDPLFLLLKKLGIASRDASGQLRGAADVMPQIANAFAKVTDPVTRARMATALFGKSGQELIPLLAGGSAEMKAMMAEMEKLGLITTAQAKEAEALNDAQDRMNKAIRGVSNAVMGSLVPALTPLVEQFTAWVIVNREWIATGVTKFITDFGKALAAIPWDQVIAGAQQMGSMLTTAFNILGGVNAVLPTFATILGGVVLKAISGTVIALSKLGLALATNPIGAAIVGIAAGAYLIYKYWTPITKFFADLWDGIKAAFDGAVQWLQTFGAQFAGGFIRDAWDPLVAWFSGLWDGIKATFDAALSWLDGFVTGFIPGVLTDAWTGVASAFTAMWNSIRAPFDAALAWLDGFVAQFVPGGLLTVWQTYVSAWAAIWDGVQAGFQAVLGWLENFRGLFTPGNLLAVWDTLSAALAAIWDAPGAAFDAALTKLTGFIAQFIPQPILDAWTAVSGFFTNLWADITAVFERAWAAIKPIIDALMAAIGPLVSAVQGVASAAGVVKEKVGGVIGGAVSGAGRALNYLNPWGGGEAAPAAMPVSPTAVSPVQAAQQAAPPQTVRMDGEVETRIKVDLAPGLTGTASTQDRGRVTSQVDVGTSMAPA